MKFECPRCGYSTNIKCNMKKHIYKKKMCKPILQDIDIKDHVTNILTSDKDTIIKNLTLEIKRLKQELDKYKKTPKNILTSFDKPNLDYLTEEKIDECCSYHISLPHEFIKDVIKLVYLNPEHKENHTVLCSNLRSGYINVYDGEQWIVKRVSLVLYDLIENTLNSIESFCKEHNLKRLIKRIEDYYDRFGDSIPNHIINTVKLLLYNQRNLIKNTKKST